MIKFFILALQALILSASFAQESVKKPSEAVLSVSDSALVKKRLETLLQHVRSNEVEKIAPMLIYRGKDLSRKWQTVMRYSDDAERKGVELVYQRIKNFLERIEDDYVYEQFLYDPSGPWYVWNLGYTFNGNRLSTAFAFKKIGNEFCLGDIDD